MSGAVLSPCEKYRFWLWREWGDFEKPMVAYCGLNPSTADGRDEDATTRRWRTFAQDGGCSGYVAVNLSPQRTAYPRELLPVPADVERQNDDFIRYAAQHAAKFVVCWGSYAGARSCLDWLRRRERRVLEILSELGQEPYCFGLNPSSATPRHPLFLRRETPLEVYRPESTRRS